MLEYKLKGLDALQRALSELPAQIEANIVRSAMRKAALAIADEARKRVPVKSGRLQKSIRVSVRARRGKVSATVKAGGGGKGGAWYAHLVEFGTAAHYIKPKKAQTLYFGGREREIVHHPGAHKQPFMRPALDASAQAAALAFAQQVRKRLTKQGINTPDIEVEDAA